tara:strand:+ start:223 stop:987 length:765 start_codon:yes stop_codon:yes gene_type:complete
MTKNIILFANKKTGLDICEFLVSQNENISRLYISNFEDDYAKKIISASKLPKEKIFHADIIKEKNHLDTLKTLDVDFMITVYWPFLLSPEIFKISKNGCINFHPSLLPINRGWFPHVHSILDGSPSGVTLHLIDENADTGPILAQKEVPLEFIDTSKTIYEKLQKEIVLLFKENWIKIRNNDILPIPQDESKSIYHKKSETDELDQINLESLSAKELINILRARTFGNKGFAYVTVNNEKIYLNLRLSHYSDFI